MPTFVSLDVETANADSSSICQIGLVEFQGGGVKSRWSTLTNPGDYFDPVNVSIHGISEASVAGSPNIREALKDLSGRLRGSIAVAHSGFDRMAIARACARNDLEFPDCRWLDSATVARRTWPEVSKKGYGLANLAARLGLTFRHHDAAEDAYVAGMVLVRAIQDSGHSLDWWIDAVNRRAKPKNLSSLPDVQVSEDGPLYGEVVCFTGALSIPRAIAASQAMRAGCVVSDGVNKKVTILVVGDQDTTKLAPGQERSAKHRKAEEMIMKGAEIRILCESDFLRLVE